MKTTKIPFRDLPTHLDLSPTGLRAFLGISGRKYLEAEQGKEDNLPKCAKGIVSTLRQVLGMEPNSVFRRRYLYILPSLRLNPAAPEVAMVAATIEQVGFDAKVPREEMTDREQQAWSAIGVHPLNRAAPIWGGEQRHEIRYDLKELRSRYCLSRQQLAEILQTKLDPINRQERMVWRERHAWSTPNDRPKFSVHAASRINLLLTISETAPPAFEHSFRKQLVVSQIDQALGVATTDWLRSIGWGASVEPCEITNRIDMLMKEVYELQLLLADKKSA